MFEAKYSRFMMTNTTRFAEEDEILERLMPAGEGAGVPLYERDGVVYVDDMDNHSMVIGGTGCGKSRASCKTTIRSLLTKGESVVVNDPKGELYKSTVGYAYKKGYKVRVLNLRHPEKSDHWNPLYQAYNYYKNGQISKAQQAIDDLSTELMQKTANERDRYWDQVAGNYFARLVEMCMICADSCDCFTFENILPLCSEDSEKYVKGMMAHIPDLSEASRSAIYSVVDLNAEKTKSCIYGVLHTGIDSLVKNDSLLKLFNSNEIDFYKLAEEPTAVYVIYPDEKSAMNSVITNFLTQAYTSLLDVCDARADNKLPIRVNFVLDEFSNLCKVEHFDNRISEARSKNIRYHLFIQSMNQLGEKYGDKVAETILSNCTSWTCFSSKETAFLDTISKLCGRVVDYTGREHCLISSSELQYLEKGEESVEVLILRQGVRPYVARLPYYDKLYDVDNSSMPAFEMITSLTSSRKLWPGDWLRLANR